MHQRNSNSSRFNGLSWGLQPHSSLHLSTELSLQAGKPHTDPAGSVTPWPSLIPSGLTETRCEPSQCTVPPRECGKCYQLRVPCHISHYHNNYFTLPLFLNIKISIRFTWKLNLKTKDTRASQAQLVLNHKGSSEFGPSLPALGVDFLTQRSYCHACGSAVA